MKVKIAIAVVVWLLVVLQATILFEAMYKNEMVNLMAVIGILLIVIVLTIIQFSIKVK